MIVDQPRPYRVRLYCDQRPVFQDRWYLTDLDFRPGDPMLWTKLQLTAVFARLLATVGIGPNHRDQRRYGLRITTHPDDLDEFFWVPGTEEPWRP